MYTFLAGIMWYLLIVIICIYLIVNISYVLINHVYLDLSILTRVLVLFFVIAKLSNILYIMDIMYDANMFSHTIHCLLICWKIIVPGEETFKFDLFSLFIFGCFPHHPLDIWFLNQIPVISLKPMSNRCRYFLICIYMASWFIFKFLINLNSVPWFFINSSLFRH